jgi:hypothetical protein
MIDTGAHGGAPLRGFRYSAFTFLLRACKKITLCLVRYADANSILRFEQTVKLFLYNA